MEIKLEVEQVVEAVAALPLEDMRQLQREIGRRVDERTLKEHPVCSVEIKVDGLKNAELLVKKIDSWYSGSADLKSVRLLKQVSESCWEEVSKS